MSIVGLSELPSCFSLFVINKIGRKISIFINMLLLSFLEAIHVIFIIFEHDTSKYIIMKRVHALSGGKYTQIKILEDLMC